MLPSLQPSRPKLPQQAPQLSHQQRRAVHELPLPKQQSHQQEYLDSPLESRPPRSQIEAMPPARTPASFPAQTFYDAATRHPVFFTNNLRKPPFPVPQMSTYGWNPVANGYIQEREKAKGGPGTKL